MRSVLEGHIQRSTDRIRVTVRLIRVSSGEAVWTSQFDEGAHDIFAVQDSISQKVAAAVEPTLSGGEQALLARRETENPEAYRLYLTGRFFGSRMTAEGLNEAIRSYERAIQLDPRFALAHAGIADANGMLGTWGYLPHDEAFPKAEQAALRALALDDGLAEAHTSLGYSKFRYNWDWTGAQQEFARAISLDPNDPTARQFYAEYLIVSKRFDEALVELNRAQDLDPLSLYVRMQAAIRFYFMRRYDEAIQHLREVNRMDPTFAIAYGVLWASYREKGLHAESVEALIENLRLSGFDETPLKALRPAFASSGVEGFERQSIEMLKNQRDSLHFSSILIAMNHALLGEKPSALDWLERARDARHGWLTELDVDPVWDSLRKEPRFARLVEQVHIPR
jgi:serine/threonine-protein kinase